MSNTVSETVEQIELFGGTSRAGQNRPDLPRPGLAHVLKRTEDVLFAVLALALFAIPMLLVAVAIRLDSPGPVLFRQKRTGLNGQPFVILKFRTMRHELADPEARIQVTTRDNRLTRLGGLLRSTSMDELPQLLNVLRGDMSLVGPRPHAPGTRAAGRLFHEVAPDYAARHRVRPGLTGLAQVRGLRGETDTEAKLIRRVESDLEYIDRWSVWLDLVILLRTAWAVLRAQMRIDPGCLP
jgi:lipopolysaccharide/colanic/teichoic acid biosynthesis glycosyltransferase